MACGGILCLREHGSRARTLSSLKPPVPRSLVAGTSEDSGRRGRWRTLAVISLACLTLNVAASDPTPDEIIRRFAAKESEFRQARQMYTYKTRMVTQILDDYGTVREQRSLLIETYFTNDGRRHQRTLKDQREISSLTMTQDDIDDATNIQPFVLTTEDLSQYDIQYQGKEKADELDTYTFSVKPRRMEKGSRYFEGRIWVDDVDFQIVKTVGRGVPQSSHEKFPQFETIRQMVDRKYWFPVWTMADERLKFGGLLQGGTSEFHVREIITYEEYRKFEVDTSIRFGDPREEPPGAYRKQGQQQKPEDGKP